jgi:shikimate kinase
VAEPPARVVLVGFMGCGKSTVGPLVARRLGYVFEDMDRRIEARTGRSVSALFAERGEEGFRYEEREEARILATLERRVIAAGGGAFARPDTRAILREGAFVVWLKCDPEALFARIPKDGSRPLAANHAIMRLLLAEREPSYSQADATVDTTRATPASVADAVAVLVERRKGRGRATGR